MKTVKLDFSGTKEKIILFEKDLAQQRQDERRKSIYRSQWAGES